MNIKLTKFVFSLMFFILTTPQIEGGASAGILPYAFHNGKAYFLLGLEQRYINPKKLPKSNWHLTSPNEGSWVWTDFGGRCDATDNTITRCAARECAEETRGFFGNAISGGQLPFKDIKKTSNKIKKSISFWQDAINKGTMFQMKATKGDYTMYLVQIDYFDNIHSIVQIRSQDKSFLEKEAFLWVDVEEVLSTANNATNVMDNIYRLPSINCKNWQPTYKSNNPSYITNRLYNYLARNLQNAQQDANFRDYIQKNIREKLAYASIHQKLTELSNALIKLKKTFPK